MRAAGVPDVGIRAFARLYRLLVDGDRGLLPGDELAPVGDLPELDDLPHGHATRDLLDRAVVLKVNGGLGTSMGLSGPKSLIEVKPGLTFLGVIVRSVIQARRLHDVRVPLVLMNSFATRAATLRALAPVADVRADVPLDFEQHREPRLRAEDLTPLDWPAAPELEWCPPGHGDLYAALLSSGLLAVLRERGYRYAFVSNADNLGAVVEPRILAWMAAEDAPFVMEVVEGTEADRKGGHLARRNARIVLRETAQTPPSDTSFTDFRRWRFYNANNLWLDLDRLADLLRAADGVLPLPLIVNRKRVDPDDDRSPEVVQLETAMGSAVGAIDGARAVHVPRSRFAPVKTTDDLLCVRSDAYAMTEEGNLAPVAGLRAPPYVELDRRYFGRLRDFEARFPAGPPSLRRCERLVVHGDVTFGRDVVVVGDVTLTGPARVPDGAVLEGAGAA
jgi:UTP--glucose-1-phosphate uridylyltransferase